MKRNVVPFLILMNNEQIRKYLSDLAFGFCIIRGWTYGHIHIMYNKQLTKDQILFNIISHIVAIHPICNVSQHPGHVCESLR